MSLLGRAFLKGHSSQAHGSDPITLSQLWRMLSTAQCVWSECGLASPLETQLSLKGKDCNKKITDFRGS